MEVDFTHRSPIPASQKRAISHRAAWNTLAGELENLANEYTNVAGHMHNYGQSFWDPYTRQYFTAKSNHFHSVSNTLRGWAKFLRMDFEGAKSAWDAAASQRDSAMQTLGDLWKVMQASPGRWKSFVRWLGSFFSSNMHYHYFTKVIDKTNQIMARVGNTPISGAAQEHIKRVLGQAVETLTPPNQRNAFFGRPDVTYGYANFAIPQITEEALEGWDRIRDKYESYYSPPSSPGDTLDNILQEGEIVSVYD